MNGRIKRFLRLNNRGDTIVEVMVSVAILAVVLGTAYVASGRSLQSSTNAGQRNQALSYAQQQVELIKSAANSDPDGRYVQYEVNTPFCIDPTSGDRKDNTDTECYFGDPAFKLIVTYDDDGTPPDKVHTVKATWESADGGEDELVLYFKSGVRGVAP